jgi:hypothetical protein
VLPRRHQKKPLSFSEILYHSPYSQAVEWETPMISAVIAMALAAAPAQASDTTRSAREAFTACLRAFVESSIQANKSAETFQSEYPQQCATQERAFRDAVIHRDTANRATRANAEESANLEVEDARVNFSERFEMSMAPQ